MKTQGPMKIPVAFRTGNLMYIRIDCPHTFIPEKEPKYMAAIPYNGVAISDIVSLSEIRRKHPDAEEYNDFTKAIGG
jgi:hypothetical protein